MEAVLSTHIASEEPGELFLTPDAWALSPRDLVSSVAQVILIYSRGRELLVHGLLPFMQMNA